jgi:hypothetical protein
MGDSMRGRRNSSNNNLILSGSKGSFSQSTFLTKDPSLPLRIDTGVAPLAEAFNRFPHENAGVSSSLVHGLESHVTERRGIAQR